MTPEERAQRIAENLAPGYNNRVWAISQAITEALADERERCAKIAEEHAYIDHHLSHYNHSMVTARLIRNPPETPNE